MKDCYRIWLIGNQYLYFSHLCEASAEAEAMKAILELDELPRIEIKLNGEWR